MSNPTSPSDLDLHAIAERVRLVLEACDVDGKEFARRCNVPYSTMRAYIGGRPPSAEFLTGAYRAFKVSPVYLLTGDGDMLVDAGPPVPDPNRGFAVIPMLPTKGGFKLHTVSEREMRYDWGAVSVSRDWLMQKGLSVDTLAAVRVRGRSMESVLSDGDMVVVDTSDTAPQTGYMYVLRQGDELLVKYCQLLPGGKLRVSSAHANFQPYDVDLATEADVEIVGRVVASMHEW